MSAFLKNGGENLRHPYRGQEKLIFGGGALPHRQKSTKERHLYDGRLAFTPKLKRTRSDLLSGRCFCDEARPHHKTLHYTSFPGLGAAFRPQTRSEDQSVFQGAAPAAFSR